MLKKLFFSFFTLFLLWFHMYVGVIQIQIQIQYLILIVFLFVTYLLSKNL